MGCERSFDEAMGARALPQAGLKTEADTGGGATFLRSVGPKSLVGLFVSLSACLSLAILSLRNLYDDELLTLYLPASRIRESVGVTAEGDVHPPGMYLLAHAGWLLTHSYRWLNVLPMAVLYLGLAIFLVSVTPLIRSQAGRAGLLLVATLHPELLMWSNTFRWYCPWTGLALIALAVTLQPGVRAPAVSAARAVCMGCLLALMFYLNYITLLFGVALAAASVMRYRPARWARAIKPCVIATGVFGLLVLPQVRTFVTVHLASGRAQQYGLGVSSLRLFQALGESEAFLPWHPLAILACVGIVIVVVLGVAAALRVRSRSGDDRVDAGRSIQAIAVFALLFGALIALSGLGGKPRSGLLLISALAVLAALGLERLRRRAQAVVLLLLAIWAVCGAVHLAGRRGLIKAGMNDRPETVASFIREGLSGRLSPPGTQTSCGVAVVYDTGVAFRLAQAKAPGLRIVSPYGGEIFGASTAGLPAGCARPLLFVVESYIDGSPDYVQDYEDELRVAETFVAGSRAVERLDPDPDAGRKRSLARLAGIASAERLPDYRFVVVWGTMYGARYTEMLSNLPYFYGVRK